MFGKLFGHWQKTDSALSLGGWALWILGIPAGAVMGWSASQLTWFWNTFQFAGVFFIGIVAWLLVGIGINLYRRKEADKDWTLDPFLLIAGIAALVLLASLAAYSYRANARTADEPGKKPIVSVERLVKDPMIRWNNDGTIWFQATHLTTGENLSIFVEYGQFGGINMGPVLSGNLHQAPKRLQIGFIPRFARATELRVMLAFVVNEDGNQQVLQWGETKYDNTRLGITWSSYSGRVVLIGQDGREDGDYQFMVIARSQEGKPAPPVILGPGLMASIFEWAADGR